MKKLRDVGQKITKKVATKWPMRFRPKKLARFTDHNEITIYHEGSGAFLSMWQAIQGAHKRVWLETFILDPDHVGNTTVDLLVEASARGCDVCYLLFIFIIIFIYFN
jgi:phosphatidylserine/phosphatidylglycerophosphate/cardiolipin synthase-like enzyme